MPTYVESKCIDCGETKNWTVKEANRWLKEHAPLSWSEYFCRTCGRERRKTYSVEVNGREGQEVKCSSCEKSILGQRKEFDRWLRENSGKTLENYLCVTCSRSQPKSHGKSGTLLYKRWKAMHARTRYAYSPQAKNVYLNKGIKVCPEWDDFSIFEEWALKNGFRPELCLDRKNENGNYEPGNCQWITQQENNAKQRHDAEFRERCRQSALNRHKKRKSGAEQKFKAEKFNGRRIGSETRETLFP